MKTIKIICVALAMAFLMTACGLFSALAETVPAEPVPTQPVETQPVQTTPPVINTDPVYTEPLETEPVTEPSEYVEPTESVEPSTPRPTEYDEGNAPATYSNYENTAGLYNPGNEQNPESDFEEINEEEILALSSGDTSGLKDFNTIKQNTTAGDEVSPLLLIFGLILLFLSIAGFTFVFVFKPDSKKTAKASASKASASAASRTSSASKGARYAQNPRTKDRRSNNDYNDGY